MGGCKRGKNWKKHYLKPTTSSLSFAHQDHRGSFGWKKPNTAREVQNCLLFRRKTPRKELFSRRQDKGTNYLSKRALKNIVASPPSISNKTINSTRKTRSFIVSWTSAKERSMKDKNNLKTNSGKQKTSSSSNKTVSNKDLISLKANMAALVIAWSKPSRQ